MHWRRVGGLALVATLFVGGSLLGLFVSEQSTTGAVGVPTLPDPKPTADPADANETAEPTSDPSSHFFGADPDR